MMQTLLTFAIPILGAASAFLFALSLIPTKSPLAAQLEALKGVTPNTADPAELVVFEKMFSTEQRGRLSQRLLEAGWYDMTPAKVGLRVAACAGIGAIFAILILRVVHAPPLAVLFLALAVAAAAAYLPFAILERAIQARKVAIQKALPNFLDMVSTTVQAGLSVNAALNYGVDAAPGPLGDEIKEALSEMRLGRSRAQALKAAAARANQQAFTSTVTAITQAEKLGSNLSKVLGELADDTRHQRIMWVEEFAAKLPVKMVFPMAFFMLPCLFVIIFGSIIAHLLADVWH
jgi:tight adherence protein C